MKKVLFLALVLAIATACSQTKESYLDGFKLFVESVQKNAQDYTKADWEKADLKEGAKDAFEKAKDTAKDAAKDVKEGTQKAVKKGEKAMEGIKDGLKD